jgi:hypothetical protein
LGFQNSELPRPLGIGVSQSLVFAISFFLTQLKIATEKGLVSVAKSDLRVLLPTTGNPAGDDEEQQERKT